MIVFVKIIHMCIEQMQVRDKGNIKYNPSRKSRKNDMVTNNFVSVVVLCRIYCSKIQSESMKILLLYTLTHAQHCLCLLYLVHFIHLCCGHYYNAFMLHPLRNWFSRSPVSPFSRINVLLGYWFVNSLLLWTVWSSHCSFYLRHICKHVDEECKWKMEWNSDDPLFKNDPLKIGGKFKPTQIWMI